jgi:hypothetical protein
MTTENQAVDSAPVVDAPVGAPAVDTAPAVEAPVVEAPAVEKPAEEPKYEIPKKFLKADGTPDYEKLAKSYQGLEKKLSSKPNIPASTADEYEWAAPEGNTLELNPEQVSKFKEMALEHGFTKAQYDFVMTSHMNVINEMVGSLGWTADRAETALKEAWGKDFENQAAAARAGFDEFAPSDADPHDPVWNHPAVMKLLARMGAELGEDSITRAPAASSGTSIQEQIAALRASPDYYTAAKQAQMEALYARLK